MRTLWRYIPGVLGPALIALGVGMLSVPAGVITVGVVLLGLDIVRGLQGVDK